MSANATCRAGAREIAYAISYVLRDSLSPVSVRFSATVMSAPFRIRVSFLASALAMLCTQAVRAGDTPLPDLIDFNRDVRPILSDNCFKCHGFDPKTRKGDRRLDTHEGAVAEKDGVRAIVEGKPADSDLSVRIHSTEKDEQMPPPKSGKQVRGGTDNKEVLSTYTGTVPDSAVSAIIPGASGDFEATYALTSDDELRQVELTGTFYAGHDANTYTLVLTDYGTSKDITAP